MCRPGLSLWTLVRLRTAGTRSISPFVAGSFLRFSYLSVFERLYTTIIPSSQHPSLELRASLNKGLGIFATERIPAYTEIVSDTPLLTIGPSEDLPEAFQQYDNFPKEMKTHFVQFHSFYNPERDKVLAEKLAKRGVPIVKIPEMVKVSSIFTSNAFNVDDTSNPNTYRRSMFPTISRINHSCVPNAHTNYNPQSEKMTVHSLSEISKDEEIEISYFNLLLPRSHRQARASKWAFECQCPACALDGSIEQMKHESRRARIRELEVAILSVANDRNATEADLHRGIEKAEEMIDLTMEHKSLMPQLPIAYEYLANLKIISYELRPNISLLEPIEDHLGDALAAEVNITGADSPASQKRRDKMKVFADVKQNILATGHMTTNAR